MDQNGDKMDEKRREKRRKRNRRKREKERETGNSQEMRAPAVSLILEILREGALLILRNIEFYRGTSLYKIIP